MPEVSLARVSSCKVTPKVYQCWLNEPRFGLCHKQKLEAAENDIVTMTGSSLLQIQSKTWAWTGLQ